MAETNSGTGSAQATTSDTQATSAQPATDNTVAAQPTKEQSCCPLIGVLFSDFLQPGQFQCWESEEWPRELLVQWFVRPTPTYAQLPPPPTSGGTLGNLGQLYTVDYGDINTGVVVLRALAIQSNVDGTLNYYLTVWNIGADAVKFDVIYRCDNVPDFDYQRLINEAKFAQEYQVTHLQIQIPTK